MSNSPKSSKSNIEAKIPSNSSNLYKKINDLDVAIYDNNQSLDKRTKAREQLHILRKSISRSTQRRNYKTATKKSWPDQFVLIRKEIFRLKKEQPTRKLSEIVKELNKRWKHIPDSMFKRFSSAFSHAHHLAIPKMMESLKLTRDGKKEKIQKASLLGCNISPDLIPNKILSDLKIINWEPNRSYPLLDQLILKSNPTVINAFKLCFEACKRLADSNKRIWILSTPSPEILTRYQSLIENWQFTEDLAGGIFYFRRNTKPRTDYKNFAPRGFEIEPQMVQYFETAYVAVRKTVHVTQNYALELQKLSSFGTTLEYLFNRLKEHGHSETPTNIRQEVTISIAKKLQEMIDYLATSNDPKKQQALSALLKIKQKIDKSPSGILSPLPTLNSINAIIRRLQMRLSNVHNQNPYNTEDGSLLLTTISKAEACFDILRERIEQSEELLNRSWKVFDAKEIIVDKIENDHRAIMGSLGLPVEALRSLRVRPFNTFSKTILKQIEVLSDTINTGSREATLNKAYEIYMLASFQKLDAAIQSVIKLINTNKEELNFNNLKTTLSHLEYILEPRNSFQNQINKELELFYANKVQIISAIIDKTSQLAADQEAQVDTKEYVVGLLDILKNIKIEESLKQLNSIDK